MTADDELRWTSSNLRSCVNRIRIPNAVAAIERRADVMQGIIDRYGKQAKHFAAARARQTIDPVQVGNLRGFTYHEVAYNIALALWSANEHKTPLPKFAKGQLDTLLAGMAGELEGARQLLAHPELLAQSARPPVASEPPATGKAGDDPPEVPHLTEDDVRIIAYLKDHHPVLKSLVDIEAGSTVSRKTAGARVARLIEVGILHRPEGDRAGVGLTTQGQTLGTLPAVR